MLEKNIKFICERELKVQFCSLVINVTSIEKYYPNGFEAFFLNEDFIGVTNGFLFVSSEMMCPPPYLYNIIDKLQLFGFKEERDFVIGMDEPNIGLNGLPIPDCALPWCERVPWLHSVASYNKGCIVWHYDYDLVLDTFNRILSLKPIYAQIWTFWYDMHPILKKFKFKILKIGYPKFIIDERRYDVVDELTFTTYERTRIPLFVGSQFGIHPRIEDAINPDYIGYVAVLEKSLLSGCVKGLSIYVVEDLKFSKKLITFNNIN